MIPNTLYNRCVKAEIRLNKSVSYLESLLPDEKIQAVIQCIKDYQSVLFDVMVSRGGVLDALIKKSQSSKKIDSKIVYKSPIYKYPL
jgi:hypothetical protein